MIDIIIGKAGSGKTKILFDKVKELKDKREKIVFLVPEQFTLEGEKEIIDMLGVEGLVSIEVLSFNRMLFKIMERYGGLKIPSIDGLGKLMVLRGILLKKAEELKLYKNAVTNIGFVTEVASAISEFDQIDVSPNQILEIISGGDIDKLLKIKLEDFYKIFSAYKEFMEGSYFDEESKYNYAIDKLRESDFLDNSSVVIWGFSSFTVLERKLIKELMEMSKELLIEISAEEGNVINSALDHTYRTYKSIVKLGEEVQKQINVIKTDGSINNEEIDFIERNLYSYSPEKYSKKPDSIHMLESQNMSNEIETVAIEIIDLLKNHNYKMKDIAVVTNAPEDYELDINRIFKEYEIEYFIDTKRGIINNNIVRHIVSMFKVLIFGFKYEDLFTYLKTGLLDYDDDLIRKFEKYIVTNQIKGRYFKREFYIADENLDQFNELRSSLVEEFEILKSSISDKDKSVEGYVKALIDYMSSKDINNKINNKIESLKESGDIKRAYEDSQIWNIITDVLDQLIDLMGDQTLKPKEFLTVLKTGLEQYQVGIIPPYSDYVLIGNLERTRIPSVKTLFVIGLNEGRVPRNFESDNIFGDEEKQSLIDLGFDITSDFHSKNLEEEYLIYSAFTKPRDSIYFSYSLSDNDSNSLRRSVLVDTLCSVFPELMIKTDKVHYGLNPADLLAKPAIRNLVNQYHKGLVSLDFLKASIDGVDSIYNIDEFIESIRKGLDFSNDIKNIKAEDVSALYDDPIITSVSRLEKFSLCPFSHFVRYGLRPKELRIKDIDNLKFGDIFHYALEVFCNNVNGTDASPEHIRKRWENINKPQAEELIKGIFKDIDDIYLNKQIIDSDKNKYFLKRMERICIRAAWTLTKHIKKGDFNPLYSELKFDRSNSENSIPPLILSLGKGKKIILEGKIDRVDLLSTDDETYLKVIDYKSGNKTLKLSDTYYGLNLQLILYLDVLLKNKTLKEGFTPSGVFYFKIDDPIIETDSDNPEEIENLISSTLKMDGVVLKDVEVVKHMDNDLEITGKSDIIPVSFKTDGDFTKNSKVLDRETMENLIGFTEEKAKDISSCIYDGDIKIKPIVNKNMTACDYCDYSSICKFDTKFEGNKYIYLKDKSDEEILEVIAQKVGEDND